MEHIHYHFVGNKDSGESLDLLRSLAWDQGIFACVRHTWTWPLYCQLKMRGLKVTFSYGLEEKAVNFIHGQVARGLLEPSDFRRYFIIGIRADYRPFPYGRFEVVQNERTAGGRRIYMPLYGQPGLLPRDEGRRGVENICFAGQANNFVDIGRLEREINRIGCNYVHKGEGEWQDMRDVDVLMGIRSFTKNPYHSKPATKLYNAWLANIPFIGGYDSAFGQVGEPGKNYLRVSTYKELIEAIARLKDDSKLYGSLVAEGKTAMAPYTDEMITRRWMDFIGRDVVPAFLQWEKRTAGVRSRLNMSGQIFGLVEKGIRPALTRFKPRSRG